MDGVGKREAKTTDDDEEEVNAAEVVHVCVHVCVCVFEREGDIEHTLYLYSLFFDEKEKEFLYLEMNVWLQSIHSDLRPEQINRA